MIGKELHLEGDLEKYQKKLNELYRGRKEIVENIKELTRRQRFMSERETKDHPQNKLPPKLGKQPSLQGEQLQKGISAEELPRSQQSISEHPHLNTQQEDIKKVVEVQSGIKDRNRRLFGGLNNYLKKAESKLSEESSKVRSKLTIEERVSQKQREQSQLFQQQKKREIEHKLEKLTVAKDSNSTEMLITENIILKNKFIAYVSDLQHCLYTQTLPSIAWKPCLTNETIQKLQEKGYDRLKVHLNAKQKSAIGTLQKIESYSQKFDFNKYRAENEKEFYTNYLDNYFRSKQLFLSTMTKPSISWAPATHNENTKQAFQASLKAREEERLAISEQNQAFYKRFEKEAVVVDYHSEDSESDH